MDEEIKVHLDAIAELAKGKKTGYLFLMTTEKHLHISKNCAEAVQAEMMFNYIENTPEVHSAFTDHVYSEMAVTDAQLASEATNENVEK